MTEVKIKKLRKDARVPTRGSESAAGYDLYAAIDGDITIGPHRTAFVGTGLAIEVPEGYFGALFARSGRAAKEGLRPANCVGVCDSDYSGEYRVAMHNDSDEIRTISSGERIAQLVVMPYLPVVFTETDSLTQTERGGGGFGSTGKM